MKLQFVLLAHVHYRQEYVTCGKPACKRCARRPAHGPYWYAYDRQTAFLKKRYIGKVLPEDVEKWAGQKRDQGAGRSP